MFYKGQSLQTSIKKTWSNEEVKKAYFSDFKGTTKKIESTEGGILWSELESLQSCLYVFTSCVNDLLDIISDFAHASSKNNFWSRINEAQQEEYSNKVKKNIFCSAAAAMALVDHARRFSKKYVIESYKDKIIEHFGSNGIHDFIQNLRNYIIHVKIIEANWKISHDFNQNKREVKFIINTNQLLEYKNWNSKSKIYISENAPEIDVYSIFKTYLDNAEKFYRWHKTAVITQFSEALNQYFKYKKCLNQLRERTSWGLVFQAIQNIKDPYIYLSKYLTNNQLEELLSYEYKSKEQIDRLIEMIDITGACDASLRAKAYELIEKSKNITSVSTMNTVTAHDF